MSVQTFEGNIVNSTGKAILFHGVYWELPLWLPVSQCGIFEDGPMSYVITVKNWLCDKNDLREFTYYDAEAIEARSRK